MRCRERARNTEEKRRERRETVSTTAKPPPPLMMAWTLTLVYHHIHPGRFFFSSHFSFVKIYHPIAFKAWLKNSVFFNSSEAISRKNVAPAGRLQRGPPGAPLARPPPTGGGGARRFHLRRNSALFRSRVYCYSVLAGWSYQSPALQVHRLQYWLFLLIVVATAVSRLKRACSRKITSCLDEKGGARTTSN